MTTASLSLPGGGVLVAGAGVGIVFNVAFNSNSAQVGGAVSTVGSGILKETTDTVPPYPMKLDECTFVGNVATATSGAIQSAAGQDEIGRSTFERNRAGAGRAVRLAGTASFDDCSFVENVSNDGEGAAISNIGSISAMENIAFSGNQYYCQPGHHLDYISEKRVSGFVLTVWSGLL